LYWGGGKVQQDLQTWIQTMDRRKFCRVRISARGKLFITDEARETDCVVDTLSPGGAGLKCKNPPQAGSHVALYVSGFGRFEGVTTRPTKEGIGVRFVCTPRKKQRIVEQLTSFVKEGLAEGISHLKYYNRAGLEITDRPLLAPNEIEVTPEMLSAGASELRAWDDPNLRAPDVLMAIYIAMARLDGRTAAGNDQQKQARRNAAKRRAGG
jgi:hypothetical protein